MIRRPPESNRPAPPFPYTTPFRSALQWQRPPARRQPGIADGVAAGRLMRAAGDAEGAAHDDRAPGDGALVDGTHGAHALADRARALRLQADEEARAVGEIGRAHV